MGIGTQGTEGLGIITVQKRELLDALRKNHDAHVADFKEALEGWRKARIEKIRQAFDAAVTLVPDSSEEDDATRYVTLPEKPQNHANDYTRVIRMLEMHTEDTIKIQEQAFAQYVLDDWAWKAHFVGTVSSYKR